MEAPALSITDWIQALSTVVALAVTFTAGAAARRDGARKGRALLSVAQTLVASANRAAQSIDLMLELAGRNPESAATALESRSFENARTALMTFPVQELPLAQAAELVASASEAMATITRQLDEHAHPHIVHQSMMLTADGGPHREWKQALRNLAAADLELVKLRVIVNNTPRGPIKRWRFNRRLRAERC